MARATWLAAAAAALAVAVATWLYVDNRALRAELARAKPAPAAAAAVVPSSSPALAATAPRAPRSATLPGAPPALPDQPAETRGQRRQRRTDEMAQMFGRLEGESAEDYKSRVMPMLSAGLIAPRMKLEEARRQAQEAAHVTPEQSARLDRAFDKVYADVLDYTNKAVADGQLSPYERNVSGWLEYAGGLGGILTDANSQIGKILDPSQVRAMSDAGFEWGEYLGVKAPWDQLDAPPPRKP